MLFVSIAIWYCISESQMRQYLLKVAFKIMFYLKTIGSMNYCASALSVNHCYFGLNIAVIKI